MKGKALIIAEKKAVDGIKKAVEFLEKTLSIMGIEAEVVIKEDGENKGVNIFLVSALVPSVLCTTTIHSPE